MWLLIAPLVKPAGFFIIVPALIFLFLQHRVHDCDVHDLLVLGCR